MNFLALRTDGYRGLNLTRRTLNAILKYPWTQNLSDPKKAEKWGAYETERRAFDFARTGSTADERSLEAEIMDWSDDVTYAVHDLEDFFRLGLIPLDRLAGSDDSEAMPFTASFHEHRISADLRESSPQPSCRNAISRPPSRGSSRTRRHPSASSIHIEGAAVTGRTSATRRRI